MQWSDGDAMRERLLAAADKRWFVYARRRAFWTGLFPRRLSMMPGGAGRCRSDGAIDLASRIEAAGGIQTPDRLVEKNRGSSRLGGECRKTQASHSLATTWSGDPSCVQAMSFRARASAWRMII